MPIILHLFKDAAGKDTLTMTDTDRPTVKKREPLTPPTTASSPRTSSNEAASPILENSTPDDIVAGVEAEIAANQKDVSAMDVLAAACAQEWGLDLLSSVCETGWARSLKRGHDEVEEENVVEQQPTKRICIKASHIIKGTQEGRKSSASIKKERIVWSTPGAEQAFSLAQCLVPVIDSKMKFDVFGKKLGRNQLIGTIVSIASGFLFDRKSISSHGQTLKESKDGKGVSPKLLVILKAGAQDTDLSKSTIRQWELPNQLKELIGMKTEESSKVWDVPFVRFVDEVKGIDKWVPAGMDKQKALYF